MPETMARHQPSTRVALLACIATLGLVGPSGCKQKARVLRVATTTSTVDSGLLATLIPRFEKQWSVRVDVIATGTGKALKLGERGDVDVVLVHARPAEDRFMAKKHGIRREDVMVNNFEILGPASDPARIKGLDPVEAMKAIASGKYRFVSRGDGSGTHSKEKRIWKRGGLSAGGWKQYTESGQGMGATLTMADQMRAYVLADRGTYLRFKRKIHLIPLAKVNALLRNPYGVIVVNPNKNPSIKRKLANAFVDYLISSKTQRMIRDFKVGGEQLFIPLRLPRP